jgi:hypothetical protein
MQTVTPFDTGKHHICIDFLLIDNTGTRHDCFGVVDTGAPRTEFSDAFLVHAGLIASVESDISIQPGLQTQKHDTLVLPSVVICGQSLKDFPVMVSRFDEGWGIGALIGLDFFRRFRVTIDYERGNLICEPYVVA